MNNLRLFRYFLPKKFWKELLLIVQLVLMILFAMAVMSPIDSYYSQYRSIRKTYQDNHSTILFFKPGNEHIGSNANVLQPFLQEIATLEGVESLTYTARAITAYPTGRKVIDGPTGLEVDEYIDTHLALYSAEAFQELLDTACASTLTDGISGGATVPILVSPSLADALPLGTTKELSFPEENVYYSCTVVGILDRNQILPSSRNFGSFPSLNNVGADLNNPKVRFIVAQHNTEKFFRTEGDGSFLMSLNPSTDPEEFLDQLNADYDTRGTFYRLTDIEKQALTFILDSNRSALFYLLLLTLLSVFGYGGYLMLTIYREQRAFSVFHMLGMRRRKLIAFQCIKGSLSIVLSLVIAVWLYPWFQANAIVGYTYTGGGTVSILYGIILLVSVLLASLLAAFRLTKNAAAISAYKGGD